MKNLLTIISIGIMLFTGFATGAPQTYWIGDPNNPGDWFDPHNWKGGVPTDQHWAYIDNGGTAEISTGDALVWTLRIGAFRSGEVVQTGGTNTIGGLLTLGDQIGSEGKYTLIGGQLSAHSVFVGAGRGRGLFTQIGGVADINGVLRIGAGRYLTSQVPVRPQGKYEFIGGQLTTTATSVGGAGHGEFIQTGGVHTVKETLSIGGPALWPIPVSIDPVPVTLDETLLTEVFGYAEAEAIELSRPLWSGRYELGGGMLVARRENINQRGTLSQTAGINRVSYLSVQRGGVYEYLGGSLQIDAGMDLKGVLDFGGTNSSLAIDNGLLNFSHGRLVDAGNASITAGVDSLIIFAQGFDPNTLGHFSSAGLVHFAGKDLRIAADEGFTGWGVIDDHVKTRGHIIASDGGRIDLNKGLFVHDGTVDLGSGRLTVRNSRSGISDGRLHAGSLTIGPGQLTPVPYPLDAVSLEEMTVTPLLYPRFYQSGGAVNVDGTLSITGGGYVLIDGTLSAGNISIGGRIPNAYKARSAFIQTGGVNNISGALHVGGYFPFPIIQPIMITEAEILDDVAYTHNLKPCPYPLPWPGPYSSVYSLRGGRLSTGSLYIGGYTRTRFIQTGGFNEVRGALSIQGRDAEYAIYDGRLSAATLTVGGRYPATGVSLCSCCRGGTLSIHSAEADISISQRLTFGYGSSLEAVEGATIRITGGAPGNEWPGSSVEFWTTNESALSDLNNLTLIFDGGSNCIATLEVGGEDMGFGMDGFFENFALDTLQIGDEIPAYVQLVDLFDNQPGWEGDEALYVKTLIFTEGSYLDLNGLNIYYLEAIFEDNSGFTNGSATPLMSTTIPEPTTFGLTVIGAVIFLLRRRVRNTNPGQK